MIVKVPIYFEVEDTQFTPQEAEEFIEILRQAIEKKVHSGMYTVRNLSFSGKDYKIILTKRDAVLKRLAGEPVKTNTKEKKVGTSD